MIETIITLHGIPIEIKYQWYSPNRIAWCLNFSQDQLWENNTIRLLDNLLRENYSRYIQRILWDEHQIRVYEEDAKAAARAEDYNPF